MLSGRRRLVLGTVLVLCTSAAGFRVPGINYPAQVREEVSILPGGRALRPFGRQVLTGTAPYAIGVSPSGKTIVSANIGLSKSIGLDYPSITVIVPGKQNSAWTMQDLRPESHRSESKAWQGVTTGLAVINDNSAWISEGDSGRVVEISLSSGSRKGAISVNGDHYTDSFTDALVCDPMRNVLAVLDPANFRVAVIDVKRGAVIASAKTGALPMALALAADGKRLYVANTASLSIIDLADPAAPKNVAEVPLGEASGPAGVAVHGDRIYVSRSHDDSVAIVDGSTARIEGTISLGIPGFGGYRGVTPLGLGFDQKTGLLLIAEAGINAVGVIDPGSRKVLGHVPVGWFPTAIEVRDGQVYVTSARGFGTGPSAPAHRIRMVGGGRQGAFSYDLEPAALRRGSVSVFSVPTEGELAHQTDVVMQANGFIADQPQGQKKIPPVRYVVLIVKGDRTFDEILGDINRAGDKVVLSDPSFARFGTEGYVSGGRKNFSLHVDVTPNHHAIASQWCFGDNFYTDADYSSDGERWLGGAIPDFWSETESLYHEAANREYSATSGAAGRRLFPHGTVTTEDLPLWSHLERHKVDVRNFGDGNTVSSDQSRADRFIEAVRRDYLQPGKPLPRFIEIHLPNDTTGPPRPDYGYDYEASYVADNDYALGRIMEFLSKSPWWNEMAVFITESGSDSGADHIDSHRTLLLGAGPWFRSNYVSHTNANFPALLSTIYKLLGVPPLNLYDAAAGDLLDMFGAVPDFAPYEAKAEDMRLFDPQKVK